MTVKIFDVEHGFCTYIIADNGNTILIDCGHNSTTGFRPSTYLLKTRCTGIERFIVSNYDSDHLSDLENLYSNMPIQILHRNNSIPTETLKRMKLESGPLSSGLKQLFKIIEGYNFPIANPPYYQNLEWQTFSIDYPKFSDTNNLSLVTFIDYFDLHFIFPGDIEKEGWLELMKNYFFKEKLKMTNIFIASHHGRESGYCKEVFNYCNPHICIISDGAFQYQTQQDFYSQHARGILFSTGSRKVLTTRKDGHITIRSNGANTEFNWSKKISYQ